MGSKVAGGVLLALGVVVGAWGANYISQSNTLVGKLSSAFNGGPSYTGHFALGFGVVLGLIGIIMLVKSKPKS